MPYVLQPLVGGELGQDVEYDHATHPPVIDRVQYVLDYPTSEDLMESLPGLHRQRGAGRSRLWPPAARVHARRSPRTPDADVWLGDDLQLWVSDRAMAVLETADLSRADIEPA